MEQLGPVIRRDVPKTVRLVQETLRALIRFARFSVGSAAATKRNAHTRAPEFVVTESERRVVQSRRLVG